jgi:hypothetical protein
MIRVPNDLSVNQAATVGRRSDKEYGRKYKKKKRDKFEDLQDSIKVALQNNPRLGDELGIPLDIRQDDPSLQEDICIVDSLNDSNGKPKKRKLSYPETYDTAAKIIR